MFPPHVALYHLKIYSKTIKQIVDRKEGMPVFSRKVRLWEVTLAVFKTGSQWKKYFTQFYTFYCHHRYARQPGYQIT